MSKTYSILIICSTIIPIMTSILVPRSQVQSQPIPPFPVVIPSSNMSSNHLFSTVVVTLNKPNTSEGNKNETQQTLIENLTGDYVLMDLVQVKGDKQNRAQKCHSSISFGTMTPLFDGTVILPFNRLAFNSAQYKVRFLNCSSVNQSRVSSLIFQPFVPVIVSNNAPFHSVPVDQTKMPVRSQIARYFDKLIRMLTNQSSQNSSQWSGTGSGMGTNVGDGNTQDKREPPNLGFSLPVTKEVFRWMAHISNGSMSCPITDEVTGSIYREIFSDISLHIIDANMFFSVLFENFHRNQTNTNEGEPSTSRIDGASTTRAISNTIEESVLESFLSPDFLGRYVVSVSITQSSCLYIPRRVADALRRLLTIGPPALPQDDEYPIPNITPSLPNPSGLSQYDMETELPKPRRRHHKYVHEKKGSIIFSTPEVSTIPTLDAGEEHENIGLDMPFLENEMPMLSVSPEISFSPIESAIPSTIVGDDEGRNDSTEEGEDLSGRNGGVCFPAQATTVMEDGRIIPLPSIEVGDMIRSANGNPTRVIALSHADPDALADFIVILTEFGTIAASSSHYLYVNQDLRTAGNVRENDTMHLINGRDARVLSVTTQPMLGLYSPVTASGSMLVSLSGSHVAVSCFTKAVAPPVAQAFLAPLRFLDNVGGNTVWVVSKFLKHGSSFWTTILPGGVTSYRTSLVK